MTLYLDSTGYVEIDSADIDGGSTVPCGGGFSFVSPKSFDCSNLGTNTVVFDIFDQYENWDSCSATITVLDTTKPIADCANTTVYLNSVFTASISATDIVNNSHVDSAVYSATGTFQTFTVPFGVTEIDITAIGAGGGPTIQGILGGKGASMTGTFSVTPGQVLNIQNLAWCHRKCTGHGSAFSSQNALDSWPSTGTDSSNVNFRNSKWDCESLKCSGSRIHRRVNVGIVDNIRCTNRSCEHAVEVNRGVRTIRNWLCCVENCNRCRARVPVLILVKNVENDSVCPQI